MRIPILFLALALLGVLTAGVSLICLESGHPRPVVTAEAVLEVSRVTQARPGPIVPESGGAARAMAIDSTRDVPATIPDAWVVGGRCQTSEGLPLRGAVELFFRASSGAVTTQVVEADEAGVYRACSPQGTRTVVARLLDLGAASSSPRLEWVAGTRTAGLPPLIALPMRRLFLRCTDEDGRGISAVKAHWLGPLGSPVPIGDAAERMARELGESNAAGTLELQHVPDQGGLILLSKGGYETQCASVPPLAPTGEKFQEQVVQLASLSPLLGIAPVDGAETWAIYPARDRFAGRTNAVSSCWVPELMSALDEPMFAEPRAGFEIARTTPGYPLLLAADKETGKVQRISKFDPIAGRYVLWLPAQETVIELADAGTESLGKGLDLGRLRLTWKSGDADVEHTVRLESGFALSATAPEIHTGLVFLDCSARMELHSGCVVLGEAEATLTPGANRLRLEPRQQPESLELQVRMADGRGIPSAEVSIHGEPGSRAELRRLRTDLTGSAWLNASTELPLWAQVLPGADHGGTESVALGSGPRSPGSPRQIVLEVRERTAAVRVRVGVADPQASATLHRIGICPVGAPEPTTAVLTVSPEGRHTDVAPWELAAALLRGGEEAIFRDLRPGAYWVYGLPLADDHGGRLVLASATCRSPLAFHERVELSPDEVANVELRAAEMMEVTLRLVLSGSGEWTDGSGRVALQAVGQFEGELSAIPSAPSLFARSIGGDRFSARVPAPGAYLVHVSGFGDVPSSHCVELRRGREAVLRRDRTVELAVERGTTIAWKPLGVSVECLSFNAEGLAIPGLPQWRNVEFELGPDEDRITLRDVDPAAQLRIHLRQGDWSCDRVVHPVSAVGSEDGHSSTRLRIPVP
jgi:hypothetical protein